MDVLQPELYWIGNICYRKNPLDSYYEKNNKQEHFEQENRGTYEVDDLDNESCESDLPIEKLSDGRFRLSISLASDYFPYLIGKGGNTKKQLENETKTHINIPKKGNTGDIVVTGNSYASIVTVHTRISLLVSTARKRQAFTHFLSIPLMGAEIKKNFLQFKQEVLTHMKYAADISEELFQVPEKLHLTIGTLVLLNDNERKKAAALLESCLDDVRNVMGSKPLEVEITGLEYMNDDPQEVDVLYGKVCSPDGSDRLQQIADLLVQRFVKAELMDRQYERVKLHATLMNTLFRIDDEDGMRKSFNAKPILEKFKDYRFGTQKVNVIHLSQRHSSSSNGYYVATSQLRLE